MKVSIRSYYSYAFCELEADIKELVKKVQEYFDSDFGQPWGLSLKKENGNESLLPKKI